jgi:hypothetical protein
MNPRPQFQASPELFSFEVEPHFGGAKSVEAKVELAKNGTDRSGFGAARTRTRYPNSRGGNASVQTDSISTAQQFSRGWSAHLWQMWTHIELHSASIGRFQRGHRSGVTKRFSFCEPAQIEGRVGIGRMAMNQGHRNPADRFAGHQSPELCGARNVPASGERRKHRAKPANVEAEIAIQKLLCQPVRPVKRMLIRPEVHRHSPEAAVLKSAPRCRAQAELERMQGAPSDSGRTCLDGGAR